MVTYGCNTGVLTPQPPGCFPDGLPTKLERIFHFQARESRRKKPLLEPLESWALVAKIPKPRLQKFPVVVFVRMFFSRTTHDLVLAGSAQKPPPAQMFLAKSEDQKIMIPHLVGGFNPSEKYL